jgi:GT2 family glycosyltransferase
LIDISAEWLVSANMAVARDVLEEFDGFHVRLDKVGKRDLVNGETHLQRRLLKAGLRCAYDPNISVGHHVPVSRLTKKWFVRRYYYQGVSDFAVDLIDRRLGLLQRLYKAVGMTTRLLGSKRNRHLLFNEFDDPELFREKCYLVVKFGYIAGLLGALRR